MGASAYLRITRPANAIVAGAGVWAGSLVAGAALAPSGRVLAGALCAVAFAAAGNVRNDLSDITLDKVAHPERPLARGELSTGAARSFAAILYAAAFAAAAFVSVAAVALVGLALLVMETYERTLKARGLAGNLAIGALGAAPFLVGALAMGARDWPRSAPAPQLTTAVLALAALAALATVAREILKDVEDAEADRGHRRTLPMRIGAQGAAMAAGATLVATVALSPLPWLQGNVLGWAYVPAVVLADLAFLGGAAAGFQRPGRGQRLVKAGMVLAILALVAGRAQVAGLA